MAVTTSLLPHTQSCVTFGQERRRTGPDRADFVISPEMLQFAARPVDSSLIGRDPASEVWGPTTRTGHARMRARAGLVETRGHHTTYAHRTAQLHPGLRVCADGGPRGGVTTSGIAGPADPDDRRGRLVDPRPARPARLRAGGRPFRFGRALDDRGPDHRSGPLAGRPRLPV